MLKLLSFEMGSFQNARCAAAQVFCSFTLFFMSGQKYALEASVVFFRRLKSFLSGYVTVTV